MNKDPKGREYFSTSEVAKILGVSRIAVLKKITTGKLKAQKVGRSYIIAAKDVMSLMGVEVSPEQRSQIENIVNKALDEYRSVFERLAKE